MKKTDKINKIKKKFKKDFWIRTGIALLLVATISLGSLSFVQAEDEASDYSFYTLSSVVAMALSTCVADPDNPDAVAQTFGQGLNVNSAGGVLGYLDDKKSRGVVGLSGATTSESSCTYDYRQLCSGDYKERAGVVQNVFSPYCSLGAVLADLGIDQTGTEKEDLKKRSIIGGIVMVAYISAQCVNVIFKFAVDLMIKLNPFQFFALANKYTNANGAKVIGVDHGSLGRNAVNELAGVTEVISRFYAQIYDFGIVVLFIMLAVMLAGILMYRTFIKTYDSRLGMVKKYAIRAAFIVFGVPLLGSTYTAILEMVSDSLDGGNTAAAKVVASTFCDFEGWVMKGDSFQLPNKVVVKYDNGHVTASNTNSAQELCYNINGLVTSGLPQLLSVNNNEKNVLEIVKSVQTSSVVKESNSADLNKWVIDMIGRYMTGKKIYASSYEQTWIAKKWGKENKANLQRYIERMDSVEDIKSNPNIYLRWSAPGFIYNGDRANPISNPFGADLTNVTCVNLNSRGKFEIDNQLKLSDMAIYNYLNSSFDDTSIKVYSSEKSSSTLIREYHYSVNVVGKGITSLVILALCVALLATYCVLGFTYAFGIVMSNIKTGLRLILSVPGAMIGSLQCVAKVVSYAVVMILELIVDILMYSISTELLYSLTIVVIGKFNDNIGTLFTGFINNEFDLTPVIGFMAIVFLVWFCEQCIALRQPINSALEQMANSVVNRFVLGGGGYSSMGGMYSRSSGSPVASQSSQISSGTSTAASPSSAGQSQLRTITDSSSPIMNTSNSFAKAGYNFADYMNSPMERGGVSLAKQISNSNHEIDERTVQKLEKKAMEELGKQIFQKAIKDNLQSQRH